MAENSQGKKYGHEINFHGPYLDGQINLTFHVVSSSNDQITTIKEIADLIREEGTIPATGNYTYYEKQEENSEVEKTKEIENTKDEASGATPRPIMKTVVGIQVDGDGIKPIFTKEENRVEPKIMMMSLESDSASDDETIYPTILSAEAPAVLADSSDDSKLITFGNLKKFAELTDGRYVQLKSDDPAPGSYATSSELSTLDSAVIKKGTLYRHMITADIEDVKTFSGSNLIHHYGTGRIWGVIYNLSSTKITSLAGISVFGIFKDDADSFSIFISDVLMSSNPPSQSAYRGNCITIWGMSITTPYFNLNNVNDTVSAVG